MNQADRDFAKDFVVRRMLAEQENERPVWEAQCKVYRDSRKLSNLKNMRLLSIIAMVAYIMLWVYSFPLAIVLTLCWPLKGYTMKRRYRRRI